MKLKAFALTLLLAVGALLAPVNTLADPTPVSPSQLTCIKAQSDVALRLRVTNNGTETIEKGKTIRYAYKTSAGGAEVKGSFILENDLAPGQWTSTLVLPQAAQETPITQCTASVKRRVVLNP